MPAAEEALLPPAQAVLLVEQTHPPWAQDIVKYMVEHVLPEDNHEAEQVARRAKLYLFVVSWITDTGSKGYPLFRFGMGREGG